jgi:hypothetical protein
MRTMFELVDGMAYSKMSVLNFHASEYGFFRIEIKVKQVAMMVDWAAWETCKIRCISNLRHSHTRARSHPLARSVLALLSFGFDVPLVLNALSEPNHHSHTLTNHQPLVRNARTITPTLSPTTKAFPELTAGLGSAFYSQEDVAELIECVTRTFELANT